MYEGQENACKFVFGMGVKGLLGEDVFVKVKQLLMPLLLHASEAKSTFLSHCTSRIAGEVAANFACESSCLYSDVSLQGHLM